MVRTSSNLLSLDATHCAVYIRHATPCYYIYAEPAPESRQQGSFTFVTFKFDKKSTIFVSYFILGAKLTKDPPPWRRDCIYVQQSLVVGNFATKG